MLYDEPVLYFRGLTLFKDFSNPDTFYYLPPEVPKIARSAEDDDDYALRLVLYRPDPNAPTPQGMENGGGFLNLDVDLRVSDQLLEEVREEVQRRFGSQANLVPVPFMNGSVELVLLGTSRDDENQPFVRKIAGSTVPALYGTQRAAFSVVLDRDGAALMKQVIEAGGDTMALALYHLTYAGIGPAYNLKITVDYQRVYEHLDLRLRAGIAASSGNSSFVGKAGFHLLMKELKENRAILVEEVDPIPGENGRDAVNQEQINGIIRDLMGSTWFKPTLAQVGQMANLAGAAGGAEGGSSGGTPSGSANGSASPSGSGTNPPQSGRVNATWTEDSKEPAQNFPAERGLEAFQPAPSGTEETLVVRGTGAIAKTGTEAGSLQPATLDGARLKVDVPAGQTRYVEITWPATQGQPSAERQPAQWTQAPGEVPPDRGVAPFQAAASGTRETLTLRGEGATARVGNSASTLQGAPLTGSTLAVEVPPGETRQVEITWPATQATEEVFHLFFDYDRPTSASDVSGYSSRNPQPPEGTLPPPASEGARFLTTSRAASSTATGPSALDAWLSTLPPGTTLELDAHASFENHQNIDTSVQQATNQVLSDRRLQVARNLIVGRFPINGRAHGHDQARTNQIPTLGNDSAPANSRGGRPQHRVVLIRAQRPGRPQTVLRGTLTRPQASQPGNGLPQSILRGHLQRGGSATPGQGSSTSKVEASFEVNLEIIQQEEKITATYELNSRKARTQEVHPQGQLILDAINPADYVLEADGAIDFFQWLEIAASTTAQWQQEGIDSIAIQIRYGPDGTGGFQRTGDLLLTPEQETDSWKVGVLHENDDPQLPIAYWYDYRVTVNFLPDVALGDQRGAVTSVGAANADSEGWIRTTERNLVIHPRDVTPAVMVDLAAGIMHYDLIERAQVALSYGPYRQNLLLSSTSSQHRLVIRPEPDLEDNRLHTTGTIFYKDGAQVPLPAKDWTLQELIVINEPRENTLLVQVILMDPRDEFERVNVRLRYEHDNRIVEDDFDLINHAQLEEWSVRLEDPNHRTWQYQATLIKKSGDIDIIEWTEGNADGLLTVGVRAVDVIPVQVTLLVPPAGDLLAVKVELRYEDAANNLLWDYAMLLRGTDQPDFTWSIPILDPQIKSYRYRVTEFYRSTGMRQGEWIEHSGTSLELIPGF
ncbi:hypothetical protein VB780_24555 [Leptolyngbya sp. CCNP1308]|uniref:hypothetical protein n=1 Tax=Leptolyngbya sp. CCNP1308 TaxID=3110255 RepID=UPI002B2099BC|nr:hypothetical protein [Leptolyngbya sp. CCNP1308]MEA5451771.1 hypothetical protein [Leptolyngbya sp. CCNP1308]